MKHDRWKTQLHTHLVLEKAYLFLSLSRYYKRTANKTLIYKQCYDADITCSPCPLIFLIMRTSSLPDRILYTRIRCASHCDNYLMFKSTVLTRDLLFNVHVGALNTAILLNTWTINKLKRTTIVVAIVKQRTPPYQSVRP